LRTIVDLAPDAALVVCHAGRITLVNQRAEMLVGYTRQQLLA
jgi:PAS domain S-box-containing protein